MYEQNHTGDLRALKKAYEQHAEDCAEAAEMTVDAGRREVYLKLARQWTEAAAALQMSPILEAAPSSLANSFATPQSDTFIACDLDTDTKPECRNLLTDPFEPRR